MEKILLCRPKGGLNDTLCQIEKCWSYAEEHNRKLIVDTTRSGLHASLDNFFEPKDNKGLVEFSDPKNSLDFLETCVPTFIAKKISSYKSEYCPQTRNHIEKNSRTPLTFDFTIDYKEQLLVHDQCGGGSESLNFFKRVNLKNKLIHQILQKKKKFHGPYNSIHIRNSDYKTDYINFFEKIKNSLSEKELLVCSDDRNVLKHAENYFSNKEVIFSSDIPDTKGKPLHSPWLAVDEETRLKNSYDCLTDLFLLAHSRKIFFTKTENGATSGFSLLAENLHSDKKLVSALTNQ